MNNPIKIYLGDLTYNTVELATDVFPLNVGYIASYCIDKFGKGQAVRSIPVNLLWRKINK